MHSHASRRLWPACDHTLLPEILVEARDGEAMLWARLPSAGQQVFTLEHGREWRLRWSLASLEDYHSGESRVVEATYLTLPSFGLFAAALEIEHVRTGAVRSTHIQVPVLRPPPDPGR